MWQSQYTDQVPESCLGMLLLKCRDGSVSVLLPPLPFMTATRSHQLAPNDADRVGTEHKHALLLKVFESFLLI